MPGSACASSFLLMWTLEFKFMCPWHTCGIPEWGSRLLIWPGPSLHIADRDRGPVPHAAAYKNSLQSRLGQGKMGPGPCASVSLLPGGRQGTHLEVVLLVPEGVVDDHGVCTYV